MCVFKASCLCTKNKETAGLVVSTPLVIEFIDGHGNFAMPKSAGRLRSLYKMRLQAPFAFGLRVPKDSWVIWSCPARGKRNPPPNVAPSPATLCTGGGSLPKVKQTLEYPAQKDAATHLCRNHLRLVGGFFELIEACKPTWAGNARSCSLTPRSPQVEESQLEDRVVVLKSDQLSRHLLVARLRWSEIERAGRGGGASNQHDDDDYVLFFHDAQFVLALTIYP